MTPKTEFEALYITCDKNNKTVTFDEWKYFIDKIDELYDKLEVQRKENTEMIKLLGGVTGVISSASFTRDSDKNAVKNIWNF